VILNGASCFTVFYSEGVVTCLGGFATMELTLCWFGQSLDADDLRSTRCQGLVQYLGRAGLVAWKGQGLEWTCMKWALENRSNSIGIGAWGLACLCRFLS